MNYISDSLLNVLYLQIVENGENVPLLVKQYKTQKQTSNCNPSIRLLVMISELG